jgi:hypothetical protein
MRKGHFTVRKHIVAFVRRRAAFRKVMHVLKRRHGSVMSDIARNSADPDIQSDVADSLREEDVEPQQGAENDTIDSADDQNEITFGAQVEDSTDDAGSRIDTPQGNPGKHTVQSGMGTLCEIMSKSTITRGKHLQPSRELRDISTNVNFRPRTCSAVVAVFNTAELLEMILLKLSPGYLFTTAQLTCRGFKSSLEGSPAFQRSMQSATRGVYLTTSFAWVLTPKCMRLSVNFTDAIGRAKFRFDFTSGLSFGRHRCIESFRRLAVSDRMPQMVEITYSKRGVTARFPYRTLSITSRDASGRITFRQIFDAVHLAAPAGREVKSLSLRLIVWGSLR